MVYAVAGEKIMEYLTMAELAEKWAEVVEEYE